MDADTHSFGIKDDSPEMSLDSSTVVLPNPSPVYPGTPAPEAVADQVEVEESPAKPVVTENDSDDTDSVVSFASPRSNASSFLDIVDAAGTSVTTGDDFNEDEFDFVDESTDEGL